MASMSFIPQLKEFLLTNGIIYTVRKYKMSDAIVNVEDIGECHRIPVGTVDRKESLIPYVEESGFETIEDWWKKIKYFIPNSWDTKYLYKVEVLGE